MGAVHQGGYLDMWRAGLMTSGAEAREAPVSESSPTPCDLCSENVEALRKTDLFAMLDKVSLAQLVGYFEALQVGGGETLCREDEEAEHAYLIVRGTFGIYRPASGGMRERRIALLGAGDCFAEGAFFTDAPLPISVRAEGEGQVLRLG